MKQIFFKTVRADGSSVWAIGKYKTFYKVGLTYSFLPKMPAHCFGLKDNEPFTPSNESVIFPEQSLECYDTIYRFRAEPEGSRVFICYGEVRAKDVLFCPVGDDWDFTRSMTKCVFTSNRFTVVGEVVHTYGRDIQSRDYRKNKVLVDLEKADCESDW